MVVDSALATRIVKQRFENITTRKIAAWKRLAERAWEPCPFCEPEFIIPLVESLAIRDLSVLYLENVSTNEWSFATVVETWPSPDVDALREMRALHSIFTFLNQPLIDRERPEQVFHDLFDKLATERPCHGLRFSLVCPTSPQQLLLREIAEDSQLSVTLSTPQTRPVGVPQPLETSLKNCSKSRRKSLNKGWRWLETQGEVRFVLNCGDSAAQAEHSINEFLRLEAQGWKEQNGTALSCNSSHSRFFRRMCKAYLSSRRLIFGELFVAGKMIASTCNILHGDTLFAFKIGWEPEFSKGSPGFWSEFLLADAIYHSQLNVVRIDSCAAPDSHLSELWPDRMEIASLDLAWTRRTKMLHAARIAMRNFRNWQEEESPEIPLF